MLGLAWLFPGLPLVVGVGLVSELCLLIGMNDEINIFS
jgi:hypothetical protein